MNLYKTNKDNKQLLANLNQKPYNPLKFAFDPFDRRCSGYSVELSPEELLSTAKGALARLEKVAGIEYKVFAKLKQDETWRSI